jgi:hypothetical protein
MDKRAAVRVPVRVRAQCRVEDYVIDGLVEDVSRSGLFLRVGKLVRPGTSAVIELDLPGEETLQLTVEIVRVESQPRPGMGLRFVGDGERAARPLANFIMKQHATTR